MHAFTHGKMELGDVAVNAFFVISGFLIANSWLRSRGLWDYSKKRIAAHLSRIHRGAARLRVPRGPARRRGRAGLAVGSADLRIYPPPPHVSPPAFHPRRFPKQPSRRERERAALDDSI